MYYFYLLLVLGLLVVLVLALSLRRRFARRYRYPYVADRFLFTPAEREFLVVLERAIGRDYRVFGRVRVADIIGLQPRLDRRTAERAYARVGERCFDFLICRADSGAIACAVNLARRSRFRQAVPRDVLDRVCAAARLPFARFRVSDVYSVVDIEDRVFTAMLAVTSRPEAGRRGYGSEDTDMPDELASTSGEPDARMPTASLAAAFGKKGPDATSGAATDSAERDAAASVSAEPALKLAEGAETDEGPVFSLGDALRDEDRSMLARGDGPRGDGPRGRGSV